MAIQPNYGAGLDLLRQDHRAALCVLLSNPTLTAATRLAGIKQLRAEYLRRCAQEQEAIEAQRRADAQVS